MAQDKDGGLNMVEFKGVCRLLDLHTFIRLGMRTSG